MGNENDGRRVPAALLHTLIHDIRNPLTAVMGYAQLIKGSTSVMGDAKAARLVDRLNAACWEMRELLSRMSVLLKLDRGELDIASQEFDVRQSVREVADLISSTFDKVVIAIDDGKEAAPCPWRGDADLFQMTFAGLLYHLVTTSDRGDEIRIDLVRSQGAVVVEVTGPAGYLSSAPESLKTREWKDVVLNRETQNPDPGFLFSFICRSLEAMGARLETEGVPESAASERGSEKRIFRLVLP